MNSNDSDLEAFESNLQATIQARELGKTAALVSHLSERIERIQTLD